MVDSDIELTLTSLRYPVMTPEGPWRPPFGISHLIGTLDAHGEDGVTELAAVSMTRSRIDALQDEVYRQVLSESGAEWLIEFDVVRVPREHRGHRFGLRLVARVLVELSAGATCRAVIMAEPSGWQSLKQRDRAPALVALDRHWRRLGFEGDPIRADVPGRLMEMTVRDYQVPEAAFVR
jgi:hypothetical protein